MPNLNNYSPNWVGRQLQKGALREKVWSIMETHNIAIGSPWSCIPDFCGAQRAATHLTTTDYWKISKVIRCNPDRSQAWVRPRALEDGKRLYVPVRNLSDDVYFIHLDPLNLIRKGIPFSDVTFADGAIEFGERVHIYEMDAIDLCVVGSVAVSRDGGRTGKGAGIADIELGIFRALEILSANTPVVTTVHDAQIVSNDEIIMEPHDTPLDLIVTPTGIINIETSYHQPGPIDWQTIPQERYDSMPFLQKLRARIER